MSTLAATDLRHGTIAGYKARCRCDMCTAANRAYLRAWRANLPAPTCLPIHVRAPHLVPFYADALAVTYSTARQLLDGEVCVDRAIVDGYRTVVDRWRFLHRKGVMP